MSNTVHNITDAQFAVEVLESTTPVLVDFWAPWCGPCKMVAPVLDEIVSEYGATLKVVKVNVDDNPDTPAQYGVRGIPTLLLFKQGQLAATKVGALTKTQLVGWLKEFGLEL